MDTVHQLLEEVIAQEPNTAASAELWELMEKHERVRAELRAIEERLATMIISSPWGPRPVSELLKRLKPLPSQA